MEEKKNVSKEVKMQPVINSEGKSSGTATNNQEQPKAYSYEELKQICNQQQGQIKQMGDYIQKLHQQIGQMTFTLQSRRMDYLFKIIEIFAEHELFDSRFVNNCITEIQEAMTLQEEPQEKDKKED